MLFVRWFLIGALVLILFGWTWIFQPWQVVAVRSMSGSFRLLLIADPQMEGYGSSLYSWLNTNFNDFYLRFLVWRGVHILGATHVAVLGDVFSFQFLPNDEFEARAARFQWCMTSASGLPLVVIAGNHDIGYGSEQSQFMQERWERVMGKKLFGRMALSKDLDLIWVNAMVLDNSNERNGWKWVESQKSGQVLLTHVPLHKAAGSCPGDSPEILRDGAGNVLSQTLLSEESSARLSEKLRPIAVFSGHDHVGCTHGVEMTLTAAQAEYWGCTGVFDGKRTVLIWGMHNTPTIVLLIATVIWPLLLLMWALFCMVNDVVTKPKSS
jgi:hypothetical protein